MPNIPDTRLPHAVSPRYEEWFNGNPYEMIKHGMYKKFRDKLKGFTPEQMAEFDALDLECNGTSKKTEKEIKHEKMSKVQDLTHKERKALRKKQAERAAKEEKKIREEKKKREEEIAAQLKAAEEEAAKALEAAAKKEDE